MRTDILVSNVLTTTVAEDGYAVKRNWIFELSLK